MADKKKQMQRIKFSTVGEMLAFLPEDQLEITERLREVILLTVPDVKEKLSYNVPFYRLRKNICFIWPGAVPWGNAVKEGVTLGFSYGYLLHDASDYLERGERKQVYTRTFYRPEDLEEEMIRHFLLESVAMDEFL
jgi:hypothetical protein